MFSLYLVGVLLSMLFISTSAEVVPSGETTRFDAELTNTVSRPVKADLLTVARVLGGAGKAFRWECWTCWVEQICCPNYCPQNC